MIKETTAFVTEDGTTFFTRTEAENYEAHMTAVGNARQYGVALRAGGMNQTAVSRRVSAVVQYLEWRQTGRIDGIEQTQEEGESAAA